ncbi:MAG: GIY-YIG nuclease family protein [Kiritimatiellia bacterium]
MDTVTANLRAECGAYVLMGAAGAYLYKGSARDVQKRVDAHLGGHVARTRNRRPLTLAHVEYTVDYSEALCREKWLKSGQGRKWLKEQIARVAEWQTQGT